MLRLLGKQFNVYYTSNWKKMLRRRKIAVKKRPISKKKMKEEIKLFNYAHQYKAVQIRKLMDKKKQTNYHLHELMNQIFYPDVRTKNYEAATVAINGLKLDLDQNSDPIERLLHRALLATQLIQIHENFRKLQEQNKLSQQTSQNNKLQILQNENLFQLKHYKLLFERLRQYLENLPKIKEKKNLQWKKSMEAVKEIKKKKPANPLLFLDASDLGKYKKWKLLLGRFQQLIGNSNYQTLNQQIQTVLSLHTSLKYLPQEVYKTIVDKIHAFYFEIKQQPSEQLKQIFDQQLKLNILRLFSQKNNTKLSSLVVIQAPENNYQRQNQEKQLIKQIIVQIIEFPKAGLKDILSIINIAKVDSDYLTKEILQKARFLFLTHIFNIDFRSTQILFESHVSHNSKSDILQLLKFDLYRKVSNCNDKYALLQGLKLFNNRKISGTNLDGYDLYRKYCQTISNFVANTVYKPEQLLQILRNYLSNNISFMSSLKILQNQFVKNIDKYTLEQLAEIQFMFWLLQCPSKILANKILQRYIKSYKNQYKLYSQEEILQLPGNYETEPPTLQEAAQIVLRKLQNLQQCLIFALWCSSHDTGKQILDNILHLYPKKNQLITTQLICLQLLEDISLRFSKYSLTWKFSTNQIIGKKTASDKKFNQFRKPTYLLMQIQNCLLEEWHFLQSNYKQNQSLKFIGNYIPALDKYISERWSNPNSPNIITQKKYSQWVIKNPQQSFFTSFKMLSNLKINLPVEMLQKRQKLANEYLKEIIQQRQKQQPSQSKKTQQVQYYKLHQ